MTDNSRRLVVLLKKTGNLERQFWEKVCAGCAADPNMGPIQAAQYADTALEQWRRRWSPIPPEEEDTKTRGEEAQS